MRNWVRKKENFQIWLNSMKVNSSLLNRDWWIFVKCTVTTLLLTACLTIWEMRPDVTVNFATISLVESSRINRRDCNVLKWYSRSQWLLRANLKDWLPMSNVFRESARLLMKRSDRMPQLMISLLSISLKQLPSRKRRKQRMKNWRNLKPKNSL